MFQNGIAEGEVNPTFGPLEAMRLSVVTDSPVWVILSEVRMKDFKNSGGIRSWTPAFQRSLAWVLGELPVLRLQWRGFDWIPERSAAESPADVFLKLKVAEMLESVWQPASCFYFVFWVTSVWFSLLVKALRSHSVSTDQTLS